MGLNNESILGSTLDWYDLSDTRWSPTGRELRRAAERRARKEAKKQQSVQKDFLS